MRETGTMHLMAISGLHIALAASVIWFLARGIQFFLPGRWIIWQIPLLAGLIFAAFYAWLTGLQPPALRTVIALVVLAVLKMSGRQWSPWQVWLTCVAAILVFDPLAVLSQSLALSAFAVAALIFGISGCLSRSGNVAGACGRWLRCCICRSVCCCFCCRFRC